MKMKRQLSVYFESEKLERQYTTSVILLTKETLKRILLVFHKKIGMCVPPGGHQEKDENPVVMATREVFEETGINIDSSLSSLIIKRSNFNILPRPDFLFEELIPHHKKEFSHYHLDQVFLLNTPFQKIPEKNKEGG